MHLALQTPIAQAIDTKGVADAALIKKVIAGDLLEMMSIRSGWSMSAIEELRALMRGMTIKIIYARTLFSCSPTPDGHSSCKGTRSTASKWFLLIKGS